MAKKMFIEVRKQCINKEFQQREKYKKLPNRNKRTAEYNTEKEKFNRGV